MPAFEKNATGPTPDELCIDFFAERSALTRRVRELVRRIDEAEAVVRELRAELASARAASARGH